MREINLIGGFYKSKTLPWSAQDVVNWAPVPAKSQGTRSPLKLRGLPGLRPLDESVIGSLRIIGNAPSGTVGVPYSYTYTVEGGAAPYAASILSGSLPAGLSFSGLEISGTPTTVQISPFQVGATDASLQSASLDDEIEIIEASDIAINQHTFSRSNQPLTTADVAIPGTPAAGDAIFVFSHLAYTSFMGVTPSFSLFESDGVTSTGSTPPGLSGTGAPGGITGFLVTSLGVGQRALDATDVANGTVRLRVPQTSDVFNAVVTIVKVSAGNYATPLSGTAPVTVANAFGLDAPARSYTPEGYGLAFVMHTGGASVSSWPLDKERRSTTSGGTTGSNGNAVFVAACYEKLTSGSSFNPAQYTLTGTATPAGITSSHVYIKRP